MFIVYFSLTIHNQKKIIKSQKAKLKEEYLIENIVVGQMIIEVDIIVKLNLNINVKIKPKTRVIQNMSCGTFVNGLVPNLANLSESRTLCNFFSTDPMFWAILFLVWPIPIFGREIFCKNKYSKTKLQNGTNYHGITPTFLHHHWANHMFCYLGPHYPYNSWFWVCYCSTNYCVHHNLQPQPPPLPLEFQLLFFKAAITVDQWSPT